MDKGIINAFDHKELCLVINPTNVATGLFHGHPYLLLGMSVLLLTFILGSKQYMCIYYNIAGWGTTWLLF